MPQQPAPTPPAPQRVDPVQPPKQKPRPEPKPEPKPKQEPEQDGGREHILQIPGGVRDKARDIGLGVAIWGLGKLFGYALAAGSGFAIPLGAGYLALRLLRARRRRKLLRRPRDDWQERLKATIESAGGSAGTKASPDPSKIRQAAYEDEPAQQQAANQRGQDRSVVVERKPAPVPPDIDIYNLMEREMADIAREYGGQAYDYFDLLRARMRQHLNLPVTGA